MAPARSLYAITTFVWDDDERKEGLQEPEVYDNRDTANKAAKKLMVRLAERLNPLGDVDEYNFEHNLDDEGLYRGRLEGGPGGHVAVEMCIYKIALNKASTRETAKRPLDNNKHAWADGEDEEGDDDDGDDDEKADEEEEEEEQPPKKKAKPAPKKAKTNSIKAALNPASRKTIPKGLPKCLAGVKLLFTGTFNTMDRVTSIATAKKYGGDVVSKLEDTDYIVLGDRAGPKKLQVINELELETITEEEFFEILENGVSEAKRERMENKRRADEEEEPERPAKKAKTAAKGRGKKK